MLDKPRERHYLLGHEAFRQFAESDPHQFFELMASDRQFDFVKELIARVEAACPTDETRILANQIKVSLSRIENYPLILIEMPEVRAYVECIYIGIVALMDLEKPDKNPCPEIGYFTLEAGEGSSGETRFFCQWDGDTHYNLAELAGEVSLSEFALLIKQRLDKHS
ncbi:hypothetical protein [Aliikangiella sp. G2MR2-5]|uniref:hypothetical protein n=1 Tax=Aliikangiella sp. G2MR2-5 TaxID=2788943 RepID=UPI0018A89534|nr:hypothetical protein [Aliikangiella sp. G2MR2-5]